MLIAVFTIDCIASHRTSIVEKWIQVGMIRAVTSSGLISPFFLVALFVAVEMFFGL